MAEPDYLSDFYRDRRVLVAGADGFIGHGCCRELTRLGATVTALSRQSESRVAPYAQHVVQFDLSNHQGLEEIVEGHTTVFDCVGATGALDSNEQAFRNIDVECRPHLNLFDACTRATSAPALIFLSSRLVYGKTLALPVDEAHRLCPASMYAVHKVTLENYLQVFRDTRGLRFVILRVSNPYGPHPGAPQKTYGVINQFIDRTLANETITLFGDGSQLRDYIYIDDLIATMLSAASQERCMGEIFNVGSGQATAMREAAELILRIVGSASTLEHIPWPEMALKVETGDYVSDIRKLQRFASIRPMTSFAEGIASTVEAVSRAAQ